MRFEKSFRAWMLASGAALAVLATVSWGQAASAAPVTAPGAPTNVIDFGSPLGSFLQWTAPTDSGGYHITSYEAAPVVSGSPCLTCQWVTTYPDTYSAGTWTVRFPGGSTSYAVRAWNAIGPSPWSAESDAILDNSGVSSQGYWLVGADGGVFAFGDAGFHGSMAGKSLDQPVVGIAATPDGKGYWLVGADGGVTAFEHEDFLGSMSGAFMSQPAVGMAAN